MVTNQNDLLDFLWGWINQILNTEEELNIPIIFGEQNAPAPIEEGAYIVIHQPMINTKIGYARKSGVNINGDQTIGSDYEVTVQLDEIAGKGDLLQILIESIERPSIQQLFKNKRVSFMRNENINRIPNMTENIWELRSTVDIILAYGYGIIENVNWIEEVENPEGTYNQP